MTDLAEIRKNIVLLRQEQELTQEELAFRSNLSVSRLQIIEYGCQNTTVDTLIRIAGALKIDSRVLGIFSRSDREIISELRQLPQFPKRRGGTLQICGKIGPCWRSWPTDLWNRNPGMRSLFWLLHWIPVLQRGMGQTALPQISLSAANVVNIWIGKATKK